MQAIANTAGFHFAFIEQGGASLYPALAFKATDPEVLRILVSIGGVEIDHFGLWHDKAGNAVAQPIFRPAYIYPVQPRKEPTLSYRFMRAIYPAFRVLFPNQVIRADDLGRAMVDVVVRNREAPETLTLENRDIRAWLLVGSDG